MFQLFHGCQYYLVEESRVHVPEYMRLTFNSYISDDDFLKKSMRIIDTN